MIYFIGHTTVAAEDAKNFLAEVKAPKNYKDQSKIDEYVEKATADQLSTASSKPFTSNVKEVYFMGVDSNGKLVESLWWTGPTMLKDFMDHMDTLSTNQNAKVFLLNSSSFLRSACIEALKKCPTNVFPKLWLLGDSTVKRCFFDLQKIFLNNADEQSRIGLFGLFKYYGVSLTTTDLANVKTQAEKLHELYNAVGFSEELLTQANSYSE